MEDIMKKVIVILITVFLIINIKAVEDMSIYDIELETISGEKTTLQQYAGKVIIIVNVASKCGFTGQYEGLQSLYEQYKERDVIVLGFPANNFINQEPGSDEEIQSFCKLNYGVTFPMFSKISVKGDDIHPLYRFLTSEETNPEHKGEISWNFNKFIIGKDGKIVDRFGSMTKPLSKKIKKAIEAAIL